MDKVRREMVNQHRIIASLHDSGGSKNPRALLLALKSVPTAFLITMTEAAREGKVSLLSLGTGISFPYM